MAIKRRQKQLKKSVKQNIKDAHNCIKHIKQELNFQGFVDDEPDILVDTSSFEYDMAIMWGVIIINIDDVICASAEYGKITPEILNNLICNKVL